MDSTQVSNTDFFENLIEHLHDGIVFLDTERKVILWNDGAEEISGYLKKDVIGNFCSENILILTDDRGMQICKDICPVKETLQDGKVRSFEAYLHHKEGFRLPVNMRVLPIFDRGKKIIGAVETFNDTSPKVLMPQKTDELKKMNMLDPLTELGNKKYLELHLKLRLEEMQKHKLPLGILLIDIDHFKRINETHGAVVGDKILRMTARTLSNNIRFFDVVGRWDGEQFLVIIFNIDENKLDLVANKLRLLVSQSNIQIEEKLLAATVSIGGTVARLRDNSDTLLQKAARFLKTCKDQGRNRVCCKFED
jgi:diguanylate cyclase (GGDEF)-like protein/PAS domain S-box-containing protein